MIRSILHSNYRRYGLLLKRGIQYGCISQNKSWFKLNEDRSPPTLINLCNQARYSTSTEEKEAVFNEDGTVRLFRSKPLKKIKIMSWASIFNALYWGFYEYFVVVEPGQDIVGGDWSADWGLAGVGMSAIFLYVVSFYSRKLVKSIDISEDHRHLKIATSAFFDKPSPNSESANFLMPLQSIETNKDFNTYITIREEGRQFFYVIELDNVEYINKDLLAYLVTEKRVPPELDMNSHDDGLTKIRTTKKRRGIKRK